MFEGDASMLSKEPKYDVILANINRNILIKDMKSYGDCLRSGGEIYFSGFYVEDIAHIQKAAEAEGLTYVSQLEKNNWVSLKFIKA